MKILIRIFIFLLLVSLLSCASAQMSRNNDNLLLLEMGMTKEQVMKIMDKPDLNEAYQSLNGKSVVIYFYYTERQLSDGNITKDECTPVVFEDGKLVGWGDEFYKYKMEVDINVKNK
jgi:outer membrane protein assembly factor BamE (lipoprotein component of BamABCDE complex)